MSKILCLDLGDVWVGIAISDPSQIIAQPLQTIAYDNLHTYLEELFSKELINTIVIGYPKTLRGTISKQTQKVIHEKEKLEKLFPKKEWLFWDERLTSKQAEKLKKITTKEQKLHTHAIAAAFILDNYLYYAKN